MRGLVLLVALMSAAALARNTQDGFHGKTISRDWEAAPNILDLVKNLRLTAFLDLVRKTALTETLSGPGPFTIIAPNNEAFKDPDSDLTKNVTALKRILLYHIINATVLSSQFTNDLLVASLLPGQGTTSIRFNIYVHGQSTVVTAEGSSIVLANQNASNGVIHVVNRVMLPPVGSISAFFTSPYGGNFSTLMAAIEVVQLADTLATKGPFTVLAPVNEAFQKMPKETFNKLLTNTTLLAKVLRYHVVPSTLWSAGLYDGQAVKTLEGSPFTVHREGKPGQPVSITLSYGKSGQAHITYPDLSATNGAVHAIDIVMLPIDV